MLGNDFGNGTPGSVRSENCAARSLLGLTNSTRENCLVIDVALNPAHEMLDIRWCRHLSRTLIVIGVLP